MPSPNMPDACLSTENNSGVGSVTGTRDIALKAAVFHEEGVGEFVMPQPSTASIQTDGTNQNSENKGNPKQQLPYEVVRSNEEVDDTMPVQVPRPSSSCSASSTSSYTSCPSTTPSSVPPSSSKSLGVPNSSDHPGVAVEEAAIEECVFAVGRLDAVTTSRMGSPSISEDVEANTAQSSASSSTTSLPEVSFRVSTSASTVNIQDTGLNCEPYGLLSLLRPRAGSNHNLTVRFAPLPELAPRKRKSSMPLGMAARSQLARKKQGSQGVHEDQDPHRQRIYVRSDGRPERGNYEVDSAEMRMLKKKVMEKLRRQQEEEEELPEDSLVVLAKKMGSAGKHLWKKMVAQKANREDASSPAEPTVAPAGVTAEMPVSGAVGPVTLSTLLEEEKVDHFDEKPPVWKQNKLDFHKPQTPAISTPS